MESLFNHVAIDRLADVTLRHLLDAALLNFYTFTLVLVRVSGLMTIGPLFGQTVVPTNVRALLILTMAVLITPTLHNHTQVAFTGLDRDGDGRVTRDEVPEQWNRRFDKRLAAAGKQPGDNLTADEFHVTPQIPPTLIDYAWVGIGEFALGFVLGLGIHTILSGLQLAGHLIDQQTGVALGEVFNPAFDVEGSLSGQVLYFLGVTVFLVMEPINGHLHVLSTLIQTFQTLPVGEATVSIASIEVLRNLIQESFILALRVAAPLLATMSLVALTMGFLGHTVPQINVLVVGFPIRALVSLLILGVTMSGAADAVIQSVPKAIDTLAEALAAIG